MDLAAESLALNARWQRLRRHAAAMTDDEPSNCILYAMKRQAHEGGDIRVRRSEYGDFEHAEWESPTGEVWVYEPDEPKRPQVTVPTRYAGHPVRIR